MKMYIFKKENQYDFNRVEVEVVSISNKAQSIVIKHEGELIKLEWDESYTFAQLVVDDIINLYIIGEDYSKGYILPLLRNTTVKDLDVAAIVKSELAKIKQASKRERDTAVQILKEIIAYYSGKNTEDLNFLQDVIELSDQGSDHFKAIKKFIADRTFGSGPTKARGESKGL